MKIVILAGGVGTRFWPLSTPENPKQFLPLFSESPMIVETLERVRPIIEPKDVYISTSAAHAPLIAEKLSSIPAANLLLEPCGRNTAPALGLVCLKLLMDDPEAVVVSLHSDHLIRRESKFLLTIQAAVEFARQNKIITLGIEPNSPETGYGYIEAGDQISFLEFHGFRPHHVAQFKEKPDFMTAQKYVESGKFFWNAGMFIFRADFMLEQYRRLAPDIYEGLMQLKPHMNDMNSEGFCRAFEALPSAPVDTAILEKSSDVLVIPCDIGWSDVGSYASLWELASKGEKGNACIGGFSFREYKSRNNLVVCHNSDREIALLGVKGLMVVDTGDTLLVGGLDECQDVKHLIS